MKLTRFCLAATIPADLVKPVPIAECIFMVVNSHCVFLLLALVAMTGCANSKHSEVQANWESPPSTEDMRGGPPSPAKQSGHRYAEEDGIGPSLVNVPLVNRFGNNNSVRPVSYDREISHWAHESMPWRYAESTNSYFSSADRADARNSLIDVPGEAIDRLPPVEDSPPSDTLTRLPPDEPLDSDITYMDLLSNQAKGIVSDYRQFYSVEGLLWLSGGLGAGALMANTGFDEYFLRDIYLENVVHAPTHEYYEKLHQPKFLGDGLYTIPAFAIAALAEPLIDDLPLGFETAQWGQRSLRTILVGGPPMLGLQLLTGASRPGETTADSRWKPFQDNNGVSGHSFMGAIPFISAAKMTDNPWLKGGLYVASAIPGLSRVNDDNHYLSQAFLGWWIAYLAASAVDRSHDPDANRRVFFYPQPGGIGLGFKY